MKIELKIVKDIDEESVFFNVREITPKIRRIIDYLDSKEKDVIIGYLEEEIVLLKPQEIIVFFTESKKVYAKTYKGTRYLIKERLYEIEENLKSYSFLRISNSSIANAKMIRKLQMGIDGSLCIVFKEGTKEFASRRCVKTIKNYLGIGG